MEKEVCRQEKVEGEESTVEREESTVKSEEAIVEREDATMERDEATMKKDEATVERDATVEGENATVEGESTSLQEVDNLVKKFEQLKISARAECENDPKPENSSVYHLKQIIWHGKKTPIVTQNENGPCPLIAISNILLLKGKIFFPSMMEMVTADQLVEYIGDAILSNMPKDLPEVRQLNYEQNMSDAISVLPKLHTGLDVNVKFTGVTNFEYTPECIIFDLLNIPLYHGWVIDPQCAEVVAAVGSLGYNQVVEKIINNKTAAQDDLVTEALIAEQFLERTASQLTYHGLCELHAAMHHDELAVLFRNNHFSTILKRKDELFQLVTDQGFLNESRVVWETLSNIDGDGMFVDGYFSTIPPKVSSTSFQETEERFDEDLARCVNEDEHQHAHSPITVGRISHGHSRPYAHTASGERNKKGSCDIL